MQTYVCIFSCLRTIKERIKHELGLTVSIGVSWNKIFAKLGSNMKKPDVITVVNKENYQITVWKLPASDLLYVGRATIIKLQKLNNLNIGEIAKADETLLTTHLGKWGGYLKTFAAGLDVTPVSKTTDSPILNPSETVLQITKI